MTALMTIGKALRDFSQASMGEGAGKGEGGNGEMQFLEFSAGQNIQILMDYDNGWSYGTFGTEDGQIKVGFFPKNFVEVLPTPIGSVPSQETTQPTEGTKQTDPNIHPRPESQNTSEPALQKKTKTESFMSFASQFLDDESLLAQIRAEEFNKHNPGLTGIEGPESIIGYRKIKPEEGKFKMIPGSSARLVNDTQVAVPIKDQHPTSKAYRQMHHYFDYDKWNEQMNANPPPKATADPTKKKKKKPHIP